MQLNGMIDFNEAKKIYTKLLTKEEKLLDIAKRLDISSESVYGLVELLTHFDLPIEIVEENEELIVKKYRKQTASKHRNVKIPIGECTKTTLGIVSDTHMCSKEQQLHMLNTAYRYFYEHEISRTLHIGDVVDGDYAEKRKGQRYSRFMNGADEQSDYIIEMYPRITGIT